MHLRPEGQADQAAVNDINVAAFGREAEARLVAMLREQARPLVSLVAEDAGAVIGHIMFSPVSLGGFARLMMGLAPMAVAPAHERRGIGSALVRAGLERCREIGAAAVVVLGHPDFLSQVRLSLRRALRSHLRIRRARGSVHGPRARAARFPRCRGHRVVPPGVRRDMTRINDPPGGSTSAAARCCSGCTPCSSVYRRCR